MKSKKGIPVTAVFDIGKTNKKFLLFDENFQIVYERYSCMEREIIKDDDGYPSENLVFLVDWVNEQLNTALEHDKFDIKELNFTTYGASLVHLDGNDEITTHFYNYLKPYPDELLQKFYETYGGKKEFALETASPPMGMLNSGLQLYWLKHKKPEKYKKIKRTLHFPQYLSSLFTNKYTSEYTSIGCHTGLWNYQKNDYHNWLKQEKMLDLFPNIQPVTDAKQTDINGKPVRVGPGIHDSSAALTPYYLGLDDPFMLLSTGTWSITLNPFNQTPLTFEELNRDCLCFMNIYGDPVKAARVFLGKEYSHQKKKMDDYFSRNNVDGEEISPDTNLLQKLIASNDAEKKLQLGKAHNSGPFQQEEPGEWQLDQFASYKEAYHQLMLDLVSIQAESIQLAEGASSVDKIIITGGFSRNDFFVELLASRFPEKEIFTGSLSHASALGAAMALNDEYAKKKLKDLLSLEKQSPLKNIDMRQYSWNKKYAKNSDTVHT